MVNDGDADSQQYKKECASLQMEFINGEAGMLLGYL